MEDAKEEIRARLAVEDVIGQYIELKRAGRRVVLAGAISAENIAAAVATGADVIDVNSSLETAPGVKSVERLDSLLSQLANLPT